MSLSLKLKVVISAILAVVTAYMLVASIFPPLTNNSVDLEDVNFVSSATYYNLANQVVEPETCVIYAYNNLTCPYTASQANCLGNQVKITANGTTSYPNVTTGHHYVSYTYSESAVWILGSNFGGFAIVLIYVGLFIAILLLLSYYL